MRRGYAAPQSDRVSHNLPMQAGSRPLPRQPVMRDPQNSM
jgi:hypothetical protein